MPTLTQPRERRDSGNANAAEYFAAAWVRGPRAIVANKMVIYDGIACEIPFEINGSAATVSRGSSALRDYLNAMYPGRAGSGSLDRCKMERDKCRLLDRKPL